MVVKNVEVINPEKVIEDLESITNDAEKVQIETLKQILEENRSAKYLLDLGINGRTDLESFKSCVPIVTPDEIQPYINRIVDGDPTPILTGKPISAISLSSGTTLGKPKLLPFNDHLMDNTLQIYATSFAFRNREFPIDANKKALQFIYGSKRGKTRGGLPIGTATTNVFSNPQFKRAMKAIHSKCCSCDEVIFGPDFRQSSYCHLLCGLLFHEEIQLVASTFAHSIVLAFGTFEQVWRELCHDIRQGQLSCQIKAASVRTAMLRLMKPNPGLADWVCAKCSSLSNWYGLIPELFPNVKYVYAIMTGSMEHYLKKLRHYAGEVPLVSADYGSSEGWIAANVNPRSPPESATFAVLPNIGYFEFIPVRNDAGGVPMEPSQAQPLGLAQVKIGEEYEIIITNFAGLYRYRVGDVVKVMGFYNKSPELKFMYRKNLLLGINIDKNTERDLQLAVEGAARRLAEERLQVVDFTSMADLSSDPAHYVIFWEIDGETSSEVLQDCCNYLDRSFVDMGYVSSRKANAIGPLELRVVNRGTFQKILERHLELGGAVGQYKMPRCLASGNNLVVQVLSDCVARTFHSGVF